MPEASARLNERRATRSAHQDFHTKPVCKKGREHKQGPRSATLTIRNALQQPPSRMTEHAQEGPPRAARKAYESPPPRARTCTWPHAHTHTRCQESVLSASAWLDRWTDGIDPLCGVGSDSQKANPPPIIAGAMASQAELPKTRASMSRGQRMCEEVACARCAKLNR